MEEFILSNIDEFNTSEAYYGNPIIEDDYISIPYINIGLMKEHPLNFSNEQVFIDFCHLHIKEPKYVSVYERGVIRNKLDNYNQDYSKWYSGFFIGDKTILDNEMEIQASDVYLIIPKDFKLSPKTWIPDFKEFKGQGNIEEKDVKAFLNRTPVLKNI